MLLIVLFGSAICAYGFYLSSIFTTKDHDASGYACGGAILMVLSWIAFTVNHLIDNENN